MAHKDLPDDKLPTVTRTVDPKFNANHHDPTSDAEAVVRINVAAQQQAEVMLNGSLG